MRGAFAGLATLVLTLMLAGSALGAAHLDRVTPLSSDYHAGDNNVPSAIVRFSEPVASDTAVSVVSSDPSTVTTPGTVTLPTGQSSAPIPITCLQQGGSNLTVAEDPSHTAEVTIRCLAPGAPTVLLDKDFGSAATGEPFTVTAMAISAVAVQDPSYRLAVTGANTVSEDKLITVGLNPPVSNPNVSFTYSGANAGTDSVKVCLLDGDQHSSGCTSYETIAVTRIAAVAGPTPAALDFGSQGIGYTSSALALTIANPGTVKLILGAATVGGQDAGDFQKFADGCSSQTLAPGASCEIDMKMTASAAGSRGATLSLPTNDPGKPVINTPLTGSGIEPTPIVATDLGQTPPPAGSTPTPSTSTPFKVTPKRDKKTGGLTLSVQLPAAGKVTFVAKSGKRIVGRASGSGDASKRLVLKLKPSALAKTSLRTRKSLPVTVSGTFTPTAGGTKPTVSFKNTFTRAKR